MMISLDHAQMKKERPFRTLLLSQFVPGCNYGVIVPLEVPVEYHARTGNEGKKMRMVDAFTVVGAMIRFRVGR